MSEEEKQGQGKAEGEQEDLIYDYPGGIFSEFSWCDWVKITLGQHGILYSFGQLHPETGKFHIVKEMIIPYSVSIAFSDLLNKHLEMAKSMGLISETISADQEEDNKSND